MLVDLDERAEALRTWGVFAYIELARDKSQMVSKELQPVEVFGLTALECIVYVIIHRHGSE